MMHMLNENLSGRSLWIMKMSVSFARFKFREHFPRIGLVNLKFSTFEKLFILLLAFLVLICCFYFHGYI